MGSIWLMAKQRGLEMQLTIICMIFIMTISVRAQTTKSTVCEDAIGAEKCAKRQGNCQKENVKLDCQLTCGECTPANITTLPPTNITTLAPTSNTTTPKNGDCLDKKGQEFCEVKRDKGKCANFMDDCALTCGECTPANGTTLAPTSNTTTPTNGDCLDKKGQEFCEMKRDKGKCANFMDDCALTCGECSSTNGTTASPTPTNGDCVDKKDQEICQNK